jgi:hypothetical protein
VRKRFWPTKRYLVERDRIHRENEEAQCTIRRRCSANQPWYLWRYLVIGRLREDNVEKALRLLRRRREIAGYVRTTHGDVSDVIYGVDFYVVRVALTSREVLKFQVSGPWFVEDHRQHHPEVPVIEVTGEETIATIVERIRVLLEAVYN